MKRSSLSTRHRRRASRNPSPTSGHITERELVLAFQNGETFAYGQIDQRYRPLVQHICRRLLKNPHDVEEATQETMLRVLQGLSRFNGRYLLQAWVARIATNVCLDVLRSRARRSGMGEPVSEDLRQAAEHAATAPQDDPCEVVERRVEQERVRDVLAELPPTHRSALVLREFQGMSHEEIAGQLDMSAPQVKALIHRAKRGFRRIWETEKPRAGLGLLIPWFLTRIRMPKFLRKITAQGTETAAGAASSPAVAAAATVGAERVTAAVAAVVVAGATGIGAVAAASQSGAAPEPTPVVAQAAPARPDRVRLITTHDKRHKAQRPVAATTPAIPLPEASPTPSVEPSPEPSPSPTEPSPEPSPSPSPDPTEPPSPAPPPEPNGFDMTFAVDLAAGSEPCPCMSLTHVESESLFASQEGGIEYLDQVLEGSAAAAGTPSYRLWLHQSSSSGTHLEVDIRLYDTEGAYQYSASGALTDRSLTPWGGWVYRYEGTYQIYSMPKADYTMPKHGRFVADVAVSWRHDRVISVGYSLSEVH